MICVPRKRSRQHFFVWSRVISRQRVDLDQTRRKIVANQLGVSLDDGPILNEVLVEQLAYGSNNSDDQLSLSELFESTDQVEYTPFTVADTNLTGEEIAMLSDLERRVDSAIEYCKMADSNWSVRLDLPNSSPVAGIGKTVPEAVQRIEIFLRLASKTDQAS